jgi:hypothetical protein
MRTEPKKTVSKKIYVISSPVAISLLAMRSNGEVHQVLGSHE